MKTIASILLTWTFISSAHATLLRDMDPDQARKAIFEISKSEIAQRLVKDDICRLTIEGLGIRHDIVKELRDVVSISENRLKFDDRPFTRSFLETNRRQLATAEEILKKDYEDALRRCADLDL